MDMVIRPRWGGKTAQMLQYAARHFAHIVVPTWADADRLAGEARLLQLNIPHPITFRDFVEARYHGLVVKAFVIDDLDRCLQSVTMMPVVAVSATGPVV
jgi:hypothetical protein